MTLGLAAPAMADNGVTGSAVGSPGVVSGNVIQVPLTVPVNACGLGISLVGLLNPTTGNACSNSI
ncbi:chaplin [Streptomyces sp. NPDC001795]|uniref:chaplin n=1 Tax=unclassified Streptomyces TaxID=2593676 RepID=UPI003327FF85